MKFLRVPFGLWDFFGYLIPGLVILTAIYELEIIPIQIAAVISKQEIILRIIILLLSAYFCGCIISPISYVLYECGCTAICGHPIKRFFKITSKNEAKVSQSKSSLYRFIPWIQEPFSDEFLDKLSCAMKDLFKLPNLANQKMANFEPLCRLKIKKESPELDFMIERESAQIWLYRGLSFSFLLLGTVEIFKDFIAFGVFLITVSILFLYSFLMRLYAKPRTIYFAIYLFWEGTVSTENKLVL